VPKDTADFDEGKKDDEVASMASVQIKEFGI